VADTAANEGQGAQRSGRLVSRVLFVLGGAVAGTAAAWLVSGAAASAGTAADAAAAAGTIEVGTASVTPVTDATTGSLGDVNHGVSRFTGDAAGGIAEAAACHQEATSWSDPQRACTTGARTVEHDVSERVGGAVSDLTETAVVGPVERTLGSFEHIARRPADTRQVIGETIAPAPAKDFGRHVWQLLDPAGPRDLNPFPGLPGIAPGTPQPAAPVAGPAPATAPVAVSTVQLPAVPRAALATLPGVQHDDLTGAAGQSRDGHRDLPSRLDPAQLPVAPSVPTAPGGTTAPGGHLDGLNFGVPFWTTEAVDSAVAAMNRAGLRHTPRTPGSQPGVTPD
jgi:hypothetical protein